MEHDQEAIAVPEPVKRHRAVVRWSLGILVLLLIVGALGARIDFNEYAISPGNAQNVAPLISIEGHQASSSEGKILLTDVYLTPVNWLVWVQAKFSNDIQIIPTDALITPGVPDSQLIPQGYLEMAQAKQQAEAAALTRLGYHVGEVPSGAQVNQVASNTPAAGTLNVGDVITAVNGATVTNTCGLVGAIHDDNPGTKVILTVQPATFSSTGTMTFGATEHLSLTLAKAPSGSVTFSCPGVTGPSKVYMGIGINDAVTYSFPLKISISTPNIGGPSAGLAMTLGIINELSDGHLLGKTTIAATGTMDALGNVGDVGGVPQKAVAVHRAGASIFLVPVGEVGPARSTTGSAMNVQSVATLDQALAVFAKQGGHITLANGKSVSPTTHP
jgi:PDZ domain-containing protein